MMVMVTIKASMVTATVEKWCLWLWLHQISRLTSSSPLDSVKREGVRGVSTIMWAIQNDYHCWDDQCQLSKCWWTMDISPGGFTWQLPYALSGPRHLQGGQEPSTGGDKMAISNHENTYYSKQLARWPADQVHTEDRLSSGGKCLFDSLPCVRQSTQVVVIFVMVETLLLFVIFFLRICHGWGLFKDDISPGVFFGCSVHWSWGVIRS